MFPSPASVETGDILQQFMAMQVFMVIVWKRDKGRSYISKQVLYYAVHPDQQPWPRAGENWVEVLYMVLLVAI